VAIKTKSSFLYGFDITNSNKFLDFQEGSTEYNAELNIGAYTLDALAIEIASKMNALSSNNYTVTVDYPTRLLTIAGDSNFSLLVTTGANSGSDVFSLIGFSSDQTGSNSYTSSSVVGSEYLPQYPLQNYTPFNHIERSSEAKVNESASGVVEIVEYSRVNFMEANIRYVTDITQSVNSPITNNANGVSDYLNFIQYAVQKKPLVFIPDIADYNTYTNCILESTPESNKGVEFKLKEIRQGGLAFYYESGSLTFRKLVG